MRSFFILPSYMTKNNIPDSRLFLTSKKFLVYFTNTFSDIKIDKRIVYLFYTILALFAINILLDWEKISSLLKFALALLFIDLIFERIYLRNPSKDLAEQARKEIKAYYVNFILVVSILAILTYEALPTWYTGGFIGILIIDLSVPMMMILTLRMKKRCYKKQHKAIGLIFLTLNSILI